MWVAVRYRAALVAVALAAGSLLPAYDSSTPLLYPPPGPRYGNHPGGNPGANLKSISHRCHLFEVAFVWELTKETIDFPLGCLQGGGNELRCLGSTHPPHTFAFPLPRFFSFKWVI